MDACLSVVDTNIFSTVAAAVAIAMAACKVAVAVAEAMLNRKSLLIRGLLAWCFAWVLLLSLAGYVIRDVIAQRKANQRADSFRNESHQKDLIKVFAPTLSLGRPAAAVLKLPISQPVINHETHPYNFAPPAVQPASPAPAGQKTPYDFAENLIV